jgi:hypothetical protein
MNAHRFLRAYMAGISVPTPLLLIALTLFSIARFVYNVPIPVERVIIFPMAIVPNLFGVWNVLYVASRSHIHLPLGIHGALLPFILAPAGFFLARSLGFLRVTNYGFVYFSVEIHYAHVALVFPAVLIVYYLVWKYLIGFFNQVAGVSEE